VLAAIQGNTVLLQCLVFMAVKL